MPSIRPTRTLADYADLLELPPHEPTTRPRMSMLDRAAQFAPYAALVGYGDMVVEAARLTDDASILDDGQIVLLDDRLQQLRDALERGEHPAVELTCFVPDSRKEGGSYQTVTGRLRRIDPVAGRLIFTDRREIAIDSIRELACDPPALHGPFPQKDD